jgi:hypothetical protein
MRSYIIRFMPSTALGAVNAMGKAVYLVSNMVARERSCGFRLSISAISFTYHDYHCCHKRGYE